MSLPYLYYNTLSFHLFSLLEVIHIQWGVFKVSTSYFHLKVCLKYFRLLSDRF